MREVPAEIPVLMYHHINHHAGDTVTVTPEVFAAQLKFLHEEGYQTLSADELIEFVSGTKTFASKSVMLTFDDGWLDNYLYAVPLLSRYQFKATFFIVTARVDAASLGLEPVDANVPEHETAKQFIQMGAAERVVFGWNLIKDLAESDLFSFYSHTVTHRKCATLYHAELQTELVDSRDRLEEKLGTRCEYLCWPYGSFTADTVSAAINVGYKALFTTIDGFCEPGSDPFMIKRIEVENSVEWLKGRLSEGTI
jgi:peptidoglycan/xylan/chitin deacetylase (PgdA/CDA1 family)